MRILYVRATPVPPPVDRGKDRFLSLSTKLEGDILQPVWFRRPDEVDRVFGTGAYREYTVGSFRYHWYLAYKGQRPKNKASTFWFYLRTGIDICKARQPACIVVYSHMTTAICAVVLKAISGSRLITEVMTSPERAYLKDRSSIRFLDRLKHWYSDLCLHVSVLSSDRVHLLYPEQLDAYSLLRHKPRSVFHDFTPISQIAAMEKTDEGECFVLLAGAPWYLKGVDIAIEAFRSLASDFPNVKLKIVGHFPDHAPQSLAAGISQIEIQSAVPHEEMMEIVSRAAILILPSRNEGLPRILMEGMAAGLPVIGSDVGGIPALICDGENGFIVPEGNAEMLAQRLRQLLADPLLRRELGRRGRERAVALTENAYAEAFWEMIERTISENP